MPQTTRLAEAEAAAGFGDLTRRRRRLAKTSTPLALSMKSTAPASNARFSWALESVTGEKHDRQVHANLAQFDEQIDARYLRQIPVEKDDVSLTGDGEPIGQRHGIGKATDDKPVIRQLISNGLATTRVVLDVEDPDEVPPQFSYLRVYSSRLSASRLNILIHCWVSTFFIKRIHHALVARMQGLRSKNT